MMAAGERTPAPARYGLLLVVLVAAYLVAAVTDARSGGAIHVAFVAAIGLLAVRHTRPWPRLAWLAAGAVLATAVAAGIGAASGSGPAEGAADIWNGLMLLATVVIIISRVLRLEQVTAQSIYGALSAYLLIGLMFAAWFGAIELLGIRAFLRRRPARERRDAAVLQLHHADHPGLRRLHRHRQPRPGAGGA